MVAYHPTNRPQSMAADLRATPSGFLIQLLQPWWTKWCISHDTLPFVVGECTQHPYGPPELQTRCSRRPLGAGADCQQWLMLPFTAHIVSSQSALSAFALSTSAPPNITFYRTHCFLSICCLRLRSSLYLSCFMDTFLLVTRLCRLHGFIYSF